MTKRDFFVSCMLGFIVGSMAQGGATETNRTDDVTEAISATTTSSRAPEPSSVKMTSTVTEVQTTAQTEALDGRTTGNFLYGYDVIPRNHIDHLKDTVYILDPEEDNYPPSGYVTSWHIYAGATGSLTLSTWRPHPVHTNEFRLVGYNNVTINSTGIHQFVIPQDHRIPFLGGDRIGMYFAERNPVSFTKRSSCDRKMVYVHDPCEFSRCRDFVFRQRESGWNPCRVYSIAAEIANETLDDADADVDAWWRETGSTEIPSDPSYIDVQLMNGRSMSEGLLLVRTPSEHWGTVCADDWDDLDAQVVCRQLGYNDGVAVFPPFFGRGNASMRIHLEDVACNGSERHLAECHRPVRWGSSECSHEEDAGVKCFNDYRNGTQHVFGYPAIPRHQTDKWKRGTYIPHPNEQLPWQRGVITSWHFYVSAKKNASLTFQVWRRKSDDNFLLVGQSHFKNVHPGHHDRHLTGKDRIFFRVGDVIGFQFERPASLAFDLSAKSCDHEEKAMYIYPMYERPSVGRAYTFKTKPAHWKPCRLYSVFAGIQTSDSPPTTASYTFNAGDTQYKVLLDRATTRSEASAICSSEMGPGGSLLDLSSQSEYNFISGALNEMPLARNDAFWISGGVHSERDFNKWAPCHPVDGHECVTLKKAKEANSPTSDYFYMHSSHCREDHLFVCELTDPLVAALGHRHKSTSATVMAPVKVTRVETRTSGPRAGIIIGVVIGILLSILIITIAAICVHRHWRLRDHLQDAESSVRFVSLEEKAPL